MPSDNPAVAVEQRHGWLIPPAWEFVSEVWEYERKPVSEVVYDHESEVGIIRSGYNSYLEYLGSVKFRHLDTFLVSTYCLITSGSVGGAIRPLMANESANTHLHRHDVSYAFV